MLIAGWDDHGPALFHAEPSGTYTKYQAKAIGSGSEGAQSSLKEQYKKDLTLKEAEVVALSILKQVMEEKITSTNVDLATVGPKYHLYTQAEVEEVMARL
jgi:20S proteasome subunit alpha 5